MIMLLFRITEKFTASPVARLLMFGPQASRTLMIMRRARDVYAMSDDSQGDNDTLLNGIGSGDHMWGDAQFINGIRTSPTAPTGTVVTGADTFVFALNSRTVTSATFARAMATRST